jgi:hypothetical protein
MAGPIAKTQPKPEDRPQQVGDLQPEVSRQFDDEPPVELAEPQAQANKPPLPEAEAHPQPGTSNNINTGEGAEAKRDLSSMPQRQP